MSLPPTAGAAGAAAEDDRPPSGHLELRSLGPDGRLAAEHAAWGANRSPPLQWTPEPAALSYAVVVQALDTPFLHWAIWNIPGVANGLAAEIPGLPRPASPGEVVQGRNGAGGHGWHGPGPAGGGQGCRLRLFALDRRLDLAPDTPLDDLLAALEAARLGDGELTAFCETPTRQ